MENFLSYFFMFRRSQTIGEKYIWLCGRQEKIICKQVLLDVVPSLALIVETMLSMHQYNALQLHSKMVTRNGQFKVLSLI